MAPSWRDVITVHPAADLFPLLGADELRELGEDIRRNGLTSPIAIMIEHNKPVLVDGRNRLDAMEVVGLRVRLEGTKTGAWKLLADELLRDRWCGLALTRTHMLATVVEIKSDPVEYIASVNIHRRHLMAETKRDLIAKLLKEHPERSDRATAELVKVDHKTVAAVRRREEDVGSIPHVEKVVDTLGRQQPTSKPKQPETVAAARAEMTGQNPEIPKAETFAPADVYQAFLAEPDTEAVKLLQRLDVMLGQDRNWAAVIKAVGPAKVRKMGNALEVKLDQFNQAKADRAEAKKQNHADKALN
jgi:hypothetical protein